MDQRFCDLVGFGTKVCRRKGRVFDRLVKYDVHALPWYDSPTTQLPIRLMRGAADGFWWCGVVGFWPPWWAWVGRQMAK